MAATEQGAELIVLGGTIHSMETDAPRAEALAVASGRILAVGSAAVLPLACPAARC